MTNRNLCYAIELHFKFIESECHFQFLIRIASVNPFKIINSFLSKGNCKISVTVGQIVNIYVKITVNSLNQSVKREHVCYEVKLYLKIIGMVLETIEILTNCSG